jgi:CheY-like chemotaxis protein
MRADLTKVRQTLFNLLSNACKFTGRGVIRLEVGRAGSPLPAEVRHSSIFNAAGNWQVLEAENGRVALEKLNGVIPAVIQLDLMMPEMDGFEFMQELRKRPAFRRVPVVVITAKDITEEDRRRLNGEVSHILQKSGFSMDELVAEVMAVVRPDFEVKGI